MREVPQCLHQVVEARVQPAQRTRRAAGQHVLRNEREGDGGAGIDHHVVTVCVFDLSPTAGLAGRGPGRVFAIAVLLTLQLAALRAATSQQLFYKYQFTVLHATARSYTPNR